MVELSACQLVLVRQSLNILLLVHGRGAIALARVDRVQLLQTCSRAWKHDCELSRGRPSGTNTRLKTPPGPVPLLQRRLCAQRCISNEGPYPVYCNMSHVT